MYVENEDYLASSDSSNESSSDESCSDSYDDDEKPFTRHKHFDASSQDGLNNNNSRKKLLTVEVSARKYYTPQQQ